MSTRCPPLRRSGFTELMADAAKSLGWHPFPGPAAIRSQEYDGLGACVYHGFCTWHGCHVDAKGSTNLSPIPKAEKAGKLKVVENARATEIVVGPDGRVTGVRYVKGNAEHFQPAKAVLVAGYTYENVRLLLLSKSSAFPNGLSNNHGQVGRHYLAHTRAGANGVIPGRRLNRFSGTGSQWTALDDWDSDFFDHSGLGFIGGGTMSATMEAKPIAAARTTPPSLPRWGSAWKAWLKQNAIAVASTSTQINTTPYEIELHRPRSDDQGSARHPGGPGDAGAEADGARGGAVRGREVPRLAARRRCVGDVARRAECGGDPDSRVRRYSYG